MTDDLDDLAALAKASRDEHDAVAGMDADDKLYAACSPERILALIARCRAAEADAARCEAAIIHAHGECRCCDAIHDALAQPPEQEAK